MAPAIPAASGGSVAPDPYSRREAIGRMSAIATAGVAAWVVPEILTAKPAGGATLSVPAPLTGATEVNGPNGTIGTGGVATAAATSPLESLASTGLDLRHDTEIGAALVAGGWAMQHWASRTPKLAADRLNEAHEAGNAGGSA